MLKRAAAVLTVLCLMSAAVLTVSATKLPDLDHNGSITILMDWDGKALNDGKLSICRVGDIAVDNADHSFVLIEELKDADIPLEDPTDRETAKALAGLVKERKLKKSSASIKKGKAEFQNVEPGLYLVTQEKKDATKGYEPIDPFLISVPNYKNERYYSEVTSDPKVPLETLPPTKPTKPSDPKLPQTGQLNWPVPLLAITGIGMFAIGWCLRYGRQKDDYEA